jgi:phosphopantothenoylcysteine synthetase/decarboxylase
MDNDAVGVIACGSSAVLNLPAYLAHLGSNAGISLSVLLTYSAGRFICRQSVAWYASDVYSSDDPGLNPTEFARRSRGIVVLPATAHMLAAAALGLAGSPAQTAVLAAERPCLFFPCMNESMWAKRTTQQHVATLRQDGHTIVEPQEQQVYVMWRREFARGPAMAAPAQAAQTIIRWLEEACPRAPRTSA